MYNLNIIPNYLSMRYNANPLMGQKLQKRASHLQHHDRVKFIIIILYSTRIAFLIILLKSILINHIFVHLIAIIIQFVKF